MDAQEWLENSDEARHFRTVWDNDLPLGLDDVVALLGAFRGIDRWIFRDGSDVNEPPLGMLVIACWSSSGHRELIRIRRGEALKRPNSFTHWMPCAEPPNAEVK